MSKRAIFLDKDGTLVDDVPYNTDPRKITLRSGVGAGLRLLTRLDYRLIVVSNQAGVAHGFFQESALGAVEDRLGDLLFREQVSLDGFYYCPHHPEGRVPHYAVPCLCRKPMPGMLLQAAREHGIELSRSWMLGDILHDVEAGNRAGCRTILIDSGSENEWRLGQHRMPTRVTGDMYTAASIIARIDGGSS